MSIGEILDQRFSLLEERISLLEKQLTKLQAENQKLRERQTVKRSSRSSLKNQSTTIQAASSDIKFHETRSAQETKDKSKNTSAEIPVGDGVVYAFGEEGLDERLFLIDVGEEYKENAVFLLQDLGNKTASVFFNPNSKNYTLPNAEVYILPYFDCDIQSGQNTPSDVVCISCGVAQWVEDGKWEVTQKAKIVIT